MNKKMKNLFQTEEWIELNLNNMKHQFKLYLEKLQKVPLSSLSDELLERANWYAAVFKYYHNDLIPALLEINQLEAKYLDLIGKNPDPVFNPIMIEIQHQKHLMNQFIERFEQIHQEFYKFVKQVKNTAA